MEESGMQRGCGCTCCTLHTLCKHTPTHPHLHIPTRSAKHTDASTRGLRRLKNLLTVKRTSPSAHSGSGGGSISSQSNTGIGVVVCVWLWLCMYVYGGYGAHVVFVYALNPHTPTTLFPPPKHRKHIHIKTQ